MKIDLASMLNKASGTQDLTPMLLEMLNGPKTQEPDSKKVSMGNEDVPMPSSFDAMDINGDGKLSRAEHNAASGVPSALDENGDFSLETLSNNLDTDQNGQVGLEEILNAMDFDGDGEVSMAEFEQYLSSAKGETADEEMPTSGAQPAEGASAVADEAPAEGENAPDEGGENAGGDHELEDDAPMSLEELKSQIDTNNDGSVSQEELLSAFDENGDGAISLEEILSVVFGDGDGIKAPGAGGKPATGADSTSAPVADGGRGEGPATSSDAVAGEEQRADAGSEGGGAESSFDGDSGGNESQEASGDSFDQMDQDNDGFVSREEYDAAQTA